MNEAILIWLYLSLCNFIEFGAILVVFSGIFVAIMFALGVVENGLEETCGQFKKYYPLKTAIFLIILASLCPSKDDLKYIVGGSLVWSGAQAASEIEGVQKLPENLVGAMNHFLEKTQQEKKND